MKPGDVVLVPEAEEGYYKIYEKAGFSKKYRILLSGIHQKAEFIKANKNYGNAIAKHLIPKEYKIKYEATNLFRVELPFFWRMLYVLTNDKDNVIVVVLDILDHKEYNKRFKYRKR